MNLKHTDLWYDSPERAEAILKWCRLPVNNNEAFESSKEFASARLAYKRKINSDKNWLETH